MIKNRLQKNLKKKAPKARELKLECYRLYEQDIPECPFIIDLYKDHAVIYEKKNDEIDDPAKIETQLDEMYSFLEESLNIPRAQIHLKKRMRQKGIQQYEKLDRQYVTVKVAEGPALFEVNLSDYLDTGLFLDHRPLRNMIYKECKKKAGGSLLNLFSYTGSISVFAALAGAKTTSVDISPVYQEWAQRNFVLNNLDPKEHQFMVADILSHLKSMLQEKRRFDWIVLDPPTFSNSKKMSDTLDLQRDHPDLIQDCMRLLSAEGVLYFSGNTKRFKLDENIFGKYHVIDITGKTIPFDFHNHKIHFCYTIKKKQTAYIEN